MNEEKCRFKTNDGLCTKWGPNHKCEPSTMDKFKNADKIDMINTDEMCQRGSIFGITYNYITPEQIELLLDGKVICIDDGEYTHYVTLLPLKVYMNGKE